MHRKYDVNIDDIKLQRRLLITCTFICKYTRDLTYKATAIYN